MVGGAEDDEVGTIRGFGELESALDVCGEGGRLSDRDARGDRPWRKEAAAATRVVRSMGERGEAGEARRERPTGPIGEQGIREREEFSGESGGRIAALRRSRGVTGDLRREGWRWVGGWRGEDWGGRAEAVWGEDLRARGDGKGTERGEKMGREEKRGVVGLTKVCWGWGRGLSESCRAESE